MSIESLRKVTSERLELRGPSTSLCKIGSCLGVSPELDVSASERSAVARWAGDSQVICVLGAHAAAVVQQVVGDGSSHFTILDLARPMSLVLEHSGKTAKVTAQVRRHREAEWRAMQHADLTLIDSRADAIDAGVLGQGKWWAVGNGYPVASEPSIGGLRELPPRLLCLSDPGQAEQAKILATQTRMAMPVLRRKVPNAQLLIVGQSFSRTLRRLEKTPGVVLVEAEDAQMLQTIRTLARSSVAGVTFHRRPSGAERILATMAEGRAVIGSPALGVAMPECVGETIVPAQGAWQIANAAADLLQSRPEAEAAGWRSYAAVRDHASWVSQWRVVGSLLRRLAEGKEAQLDTPGHEGEPVLAGRTAELVRLGS